MNIRRGLMIGMGENIANVLRRLNMAYGLTFEPGYVAGNGSISYASDTNKEVVSDYVENRFLTDERYVAVVEYVGNTTGASVGGWIGIGMYDDAKVFRTRNGPSVVLNIQIGENGYTVFGPFPQTYSDGYCRISYRSFGNSNIYIIPVIRLMTEVFNPNNISGHTT